MSQCVFLVESLITSYSKLLDYDDKNSRVETESGGKNIGNSSIQEKMVQLLAM